MVAMAAALAWAPRLALSGLHRGLLVVFGLGVLWRLAALVARPRAALAPELPDAALPRYTVIAPMYQEGAVAAQLVANLARLDYPADRLQVLIALEADDLATRAAVLAARPPPFVQVVLAPPGGPRTKPRACNAALRQATGELVVVYDAEDAPDPGQLREAAARFAAAPAGLACLQAPLRIVLGRRRGLVQRQFALEYAALFEVMLPAYARWGLPFPLGGTSNHFRRCALEAVGGWDPYNVTEDADVGLRLAAGGYRLGVLARPHLRDRAGLRRLAAPARPLGEGLHADLGRAHAHALRRRLAPLRRPAAHARLRDRVGGAARAAGAGRGGERAGGGRLPARASAPARHRPRRPGAVPGGMVDGAGLHGRWARGGRAGGCTPPTPCSPRSTGPCSRWRPPSRSSS